MPIKVKFISTGFGEYFEKIVRAGKDIDAITDEALIAGADVLLKGMKERAPKDSGNLIEHLGRSEPHSYGNFHAINVGISDLGKKLSAYGKKAPKGTRVPGKRNLRWWDQEFLYFVYMEYGSAHAPAHPYVRPTLDHDMAQAKKAMREVFKDRGAL